MTQAATSSFEVTEVLREMNWTLVSAGGLFQVWQSSDEQDGEILIPLDPKRGDYQPLLARARNQLVHMYGSVVESLIADLELRSRAMLRALHWKKDSPVSSGLIGWDQGEALFASARAQLASAAKAARDKRAYYGNANSYIAKAFLENTLMGQTGAGSYIITAYTPMEQKFFVSQAAEERHQRRPEDLWDSERISGEEIVGTLQSALQAVRDHLDDYKKVPRIEPFLETVSAGVSFELARALTSLVDGGDAAVQIEIPNSHAPTSRAVEIAFESVEAPVLTRVMNAFAVDQEPQRVTLVGDVTLLSRAFTGGDRVIRLDIAGPGRSSSRKARVRLDAEQYEVALDAHRQEVPLSVTGILERDGRLFWMNSAEHVQAAATVKPSGDAPKAPAPAANQEPSLFDLEE